MHNSITSRFSVLLALAVGLSPGVADASNGWVKGRLNLHNKNANYCPTGQDCSGTLYYQSQYNALVPVPEALIQVIVGGVVVGSSSTTANGDYLISWTSGATPVNVNGNIRVVWRQKDNRFSIQPVKVTPRDVYSSNAPTIVLTHGTIQTSPQPYSYGFGSSAGANPVANVYWAAWKMWNKLKTSTRMEDYFWQVQILAFENAQTNITGCSGTPCAFGKYSKQNKPPRPNWADMVPTIVLDAGGATPYRPQARVMHEMGHIADYLASPFQGSQRSASYCYAGSCGWSLATNEYRSASFSEGLAEFIAITGFQNGNGNPWVCDANGNSALSASHCWPNGQPMSYRIEQSSGAACGALEGRKPISVARYLWDIYDTTNDGVGGDTTAANLFDILEALSYWPCPGYPACYGAGQLHDEFTFVSSDFSSVNYNAMQPDEANAGRFRDVMSVNYPGAINTNGAYTYNCLNVF